MSSLTSKKTNRTVWDEDKIITFDIETEGWTDVVAIGWYDGSEYNQYTTENHDQPVKKFVDEVVTSRKNRNKRFVAHNGGNFDFGFLLPHILDKDGYGCQILKRGSGNLFFIKIIEEYTYPCDEHENMDYGCSDCKTVKHNTYLQDSYALLPRSLDYLAEAYSDMENKEFDEEQYDKIKSDWSEMDEDFKNELVEYLENDCKILMDIIQNFAKTVDSLGEKDIGLSLTVGSTTMNTYRTQFMADDEVDTIPHSTDEEEEKFRKSYYAGRTEVFRMAQEDGETLYHYDINSLFPFIYTHHKMPTGKPTLFEGPKMEQYENFSQSGEYGGVVKIKGTVPEDCKYPVLPQKVKTEDSETEKVIFAAGKISGWYMMKEVEYAREVGALELEEVEKMVVCEQTNQFNEYGEKLYELKNSIDKHKNPGKYVTVKLLLNSFYGKFGMKRKQSEIKQVPNVREIFQNPDIGHTSTGSTNNKPTGEVKNDDDVGLESMGVITTETESEASYIVPRIASSITAGARIELHKWIMRVRKAGGKVYYTDTDSIVTDTRLEEIEPNKGDWVNEELGGMDLENCIEEAYFLRPKTYAEKPNKEGEELDGEVIKGKGMRNIEEQIEFNHYREAFKNNIPEIIGVEWKGVKSVYVTMKNNYKAGVETETYSRKLTGFDDKREHNEDGTDSMPLIIQPE